MDPKSLFSLSDHLEALSKEGVSIGVQKGPPIGVQKGPLCGAA